MERGAPRDLVGVLRLWIGVLAPVAWRWTAGAMFYVADALNHKIRLGSHHRTRFQPEYLVAGKSKSSRQPTNWSPCCRRVAQASGLRVHGAFPPRGRFARTSRRDGRATTSKWELLRRVPRDLSWFTSSAARCGRSFGLGVHPGISYTFPPGRDPGRPRTKPESL